MKLAPETRTTVESILNKIKNTLDNSVYIKYDDGEFRVLLEEGDND